MNSFGVGSTADRRRSPAAARRVSGWRCLATHCRPIGRLARSTAWTQAGIVAAASCSSSTRCLIWNGDDFVGICFAYSCTRHRFGETDLLRLPCALKTASMAPLVILELDAFGLPTTLRNASAGSSSSDDELSVPLAPAAPLVWENSLQLPLTQAENSVYVKQSSEIYQVDYNVRLDSTFSTSFVSFLAFLRLKPEPERRATGNREEKYSGQNNKKFHFSL